MATDKTTVPTTNGDLFKAQVGLNVLAAAKRGKVDLFGTFKYHLSVWRSAVDKQIDEINKSRLNLRDTSAKKDAKDNPITHQVDDTSPNNVQVVLVDPLQFEKDEAQIFKAAVEITAHVPKLKIADVLALDLSEVKGDYSGALLFIDMGDIGDESAATETARAEA